MSDFVPGPLDMLDDRLRAAFRAYADTPTAEPTPESVDRMRHRMRRNTLVVRGAAVAVAAAAVAAVVLAIGAVGSHTSRRIEPAGPTTIRDIKTPAALPARLTTITPTGHFAINLPQSDAMNVTSGSGTVWVAGDPTLQIDAATHHVRRLSLSTSQIVVRTAGVFAGVGDATNGLVRLDPQTGVVVHRYRTDAPVIGFAVVGNAAYFADVSTDQVVRVDLSTGAVQRRDMPSGVSDAGNHNVAAGFGAVWVQAGPTLLRIDPTTLKATGRVVITTDGPPTPKNLYAANGSIWAVNDNSQVGGLFRIDPTTLHVQWALAVDGTELAFSPGRVWSSSAIGLVRLDANRNVATGKSVPDKDTFPSVAVVGHELWLVHNRGVDIFPLS